MRWSVWLSAIAVPFGAAINLLVARVGPETIGVYGLLSVYIGLITAFLYFGGDTVVIKFTADCSEEDRASFLLSYLVVILIVLVPWLVFAYFCPAAMHLVLGKGPDDRTDFLLLCLAPLPIIFHMVIACSKGMLDIRFSQTLAKLLTIISLLAYGIIFLVARQLLATHPTTVIWGIYLGLTAILAGVGAVRVFRLSGRLRIRFYLPNGFWRYAVDTQQVGIVYFLTSRIDYVLILNFGGLAILGKYVAIMAVAATVPMMNGLFMDTLLPSLTNMIAARNDRAAAEVFMMHMRILFLVTVAVSCAIMVLAVPATMVMGAKYRSIAGLIILMAMLQGVASPGVFGGTLLSSVGRQSLAVWTGVLDVALFGILFLGTWYRWNLTGAVVAYGLSVLVSNALLMTVALRAARIYPSIIGLWFKAALVQATLGTIALYWTPLGPIAATLTWVVAMAAFFRVSHYEVSEFKLLAQTFVPGIFPAIE